MTKEFWEIFLPEDIRVFASRFDGRNGTAEIKFSYAGMTTVHTAKFVRDLKAHWHLDEIL